MTMAVDELRGIVRDALQRAGISQAEASRRLNLSTKHMSHMLTGKAPLTLDWAEQILALCGQRLTVWALAGEAPVTQPTDRPGINEPTSAQLD